MGGKKIPMNRHAAAAAERKNTAAEAKAKAQQKAEDDAYWADDGDKKGKKKAAKADAEAQKAREKQMKKEEQRALEREEEASYAKAPKVTQHQIQKELSKQAKKKSAPSNVKTEEEVSKALPSTNANRTGGGDVDATGLQAAVEQLEKVNFKQDAGEDQHPERRLKAAHLAFEEKMIPQLKAENPGLKHSQIKDMCFKMWQKSPENPMVKEAMRRHAAMMAQN